MKRRLAGIIALAACSAACSKDPIAKPPSLLDGIELPVVKLSGYAPIEPHAPLVGATPTGLWFEGKAVIPLVQGVVAPTEKDGGEHGMKIQRLSTVLAIHMDTAPRPPLQLALDRSLTYGLLVEIMFSAKQPASGWKTFELLAKAGEATVAVPITLPEKAPPSKSIAPPIEPGAVDGADRDPFSVGRQLPMKPIQRCYKTLLKKAPTARGKIMLSFGVDRTGGVHDGDARGFDAELDACIEKDMAAWKLPGAAGDSGLIEYRHTLQLVPDGDAPSVDPPKDSHAPPAPIDRPLGIIVSVTKDELLVWSFSQLEGSLREPKLRVALTSPTALEQVSGALAEIVKRRWPATRPDDTKTIVFMADRATSMQRVAELLGAIRPAFPDVTFSTGFE